MRCLVQAGEYEAVAMHFRNAYIARSKHLRGGNPARVGQFILEATCVYSCDYRVTGFWPNWRPANVFTGDMLGKTSPGFLTRMVSTPGH